MYIRIVLGFAPTFFFTSKYSFSSGVGYFMRPILLIMWKALQSSILRDNNNNNNNNNNNKTVVIPVVVVALGTVKEGMVENIKKVSERATMTENQKICMLRSARILKKVLSV